MAVATLVIHVLLANGIVAAQERLTFDAASVKPTTLPPGRALVRGLIANMGQEYSPKGGPGSNDPGRIHYPLVTLIGLLQRAYPGYFEISGPEWTGEDLLSVDATMPTATTREQFRVMLQNLLIDRFALRTHVEKKEITGYALTVMKNGPKFKESAPDDQPVNSDYKDHMAADGWPAVQPHMRGFVRQFGPGGRFRLVGGHATMSELAKQLGDLLNSVVDDHTGLTRAYDLSLIFAGQVGGQHGASAILQPPPPSDDSSAAEPLPDILSALQQQLGLKLGKQKVTVEVLVVDHLEKIPTGN